MPKQVGGVEYELGVDMRKLKKGFSDADKQAKKSGKTVESAFGKSAAKGIAKADQQAKGFRGTLTSIGKSGTLKQGLLQGLGIGSGAMLIAGGIMAGRRALEGTIGAATRFDAAMTKSLAIMSDVSEAMEDEMVAAAKNVAKATTVSATEAADAYFYLASAGLDAAQSVSALPQVARFAQAGAFDMALATDLLTDAQSALGLTVEDTAQNIENMTYVSDALVKSNQLANATVQQFSEALTNRGAAALRLYGQNLEEGLAILAAWADQGVKGAEAGTRLDIVLRDLTTTARKNADEYQRFGVDVFDANGNLRTATDIIVNLDEALEGMSDRQVNATLAQLGFQQRSISATASLLGLSDKVKTYRHDLHGLGGATQRVADKQLESFDAKLRQLENTLEVIGISLGDMLIDPLGELADVIREDALPALDDLAGWWADVPEDIQGHILNLIKLPWQLPLDYIGTSARVAGDGVRELGNATGWYSTEAQFAESAALALLMAQSDLTGTLEETTTASGDAAKSLDGLTDSEGNAITETELLDIGLQMLADRGLKEVAEDAKEATKRLRELLKGPDQERRQLVTLRKQLQANIKLRREAARQNQADAWAEADANVTRLRLQVEAAETARKHHKQQMRRFQDRQDARKGEGRWVKRLADQYDVSEKRTSRILKRNRGDLEKTRKKLKAIKEKAEEVGEQEPTVEVKAPGLAGIIAKFRELVGFFGVRYSATFLAEAEASEGKASGGSVVGGRLYGVNERGLESYFRPNGLGTVLTTDKTNLALNVGAAMLASPQSSPPAASVTHIHAHIHAGAFLGSPLDAEHAARQLAPALNRHITRINP